MITIPITLKDDNKLIIIHPSTFLTSNNNFRNFMENIALFRNLRQLLRVP